MRTIDLQKIAQATFVKLYTEGHIVCKDFPALRCTKMQTTLAQAETEEQEFNELCEVHKGYSKTMILNYALEEFIKKYK